MSGTMNPEAGSGEPPDRPGVIALPPLIYLAALLIGLLLHGLRPLALPVSLAVRWAGGVLIVLAIAFATWARKEFGRAGTNVNPTQPATALVPSGPYRFTRNPMYVSLAVLFVGLALVTRVGWLPILLVPVLALMHWGVVLREERYLRRKFGADYEAYRTRVRRYF